MPTVTIFGSARVAPDTLEYLETAALGRALAERGFDLCNGGYGGTMEAAARGAREAGGRVAGVTLAGGTRHENAYSDEVIVAEALLERIDTLIRRADAFVVLPGGTGTLAEVGVVLEYMNKHLIPVRPIAFLTDYWLPLLDILSGEKLMQGAPAAGGSGCVVRGPVAVAPGWREAVAFIARAVRAQAGGAL